MLRKVWGHIPFLKNSMMRREERRWDIFPFYSILLKFTLFYSNLPIVTLTLALFSAARG
jgi:hypothetical protein